MIILPRHMKDFLGRNELKQRGNNFKNYFRMKTNLIQTGTIS